ncbi:MAG: hypothetical protein EBR86_15270 [Planctomycetia bacterium]|nr:hypothetical protein [Planctomycetia bacterium]
MTVEQFRDALRARPFRPFALHLADGRAVPVRHPEWALASPSGRTTVVMQPDDSMNIIDLLLVTDLEFGEPGDAAEGSSGPPEKLAG